MLKNYSFDYKSRYQADRHKVCPEIRVLYLLFVFRRNPYQGGNLFYAVDIDIKMAIFIL